VARRDACALNLEHAAAVVTKDSFRHLAAG